MIISPTSIMLHHFTKFHSWTHHADMTSNQGYIQFSNKETYQSITYPLVCLNGLWFSSNYDHTDIQSECIKSNYTPLTRRLSSSGTYELIHARMGHLGEKAMCTLHLHADGIPKLQKPTYFKCLTCMLSKSYKQPIPAQTGVKTGHGTRTTLASDTRDTPGCHFHMDMGFICGSKYSHKREDGHLVTSLDGYNSYLLIIDRATRYLWVFLSCYKMPPIQTIKMFLQTHGSKSTQQKFIRTDEGGEFWGSHQFQQAIRDAGYILEPMASDASFQNGLAECPNCTLGDMMRTLLHSAGLGPQYWSWALIHAVYLKNRLPHPTTNVTPYEVYTGMHPNISKVQIFGCPVVCHLLASDQQSWIHTRHLESS